MTFYPLYIVELFHENILYSFVFEILPRKNGITPPNMTTKQQIKWNSMFKNEHPIRICSINGSPIVDGYAVAYVLECEYGGTTLSSIHLNGKNYEPEHCVEYWFPGTKRPDELIDGSMRVYMNKTSSMDIVFLTPLNTIPYMCSDGTFAYQYMIVAKEVMLPPEPKSYKCKLDYPRCKVPVTVYQIGDQYEMVDKTAMITHLIHCAVTFREIAEINGFEKEGSHFVSILK